MCIPSMKCCIIPIIEINTLKRHRNVKTLSHNHNQYRIEQNFGGKNFWRNCDFETLAEKTLANPRLACIFIIVRAR